MGKDIEHELETGGWGCMVMGSNKLKLQVITR